MIKASTNKHLTFAVIGSILLTACGSSENTTDTTENAGTTDTPAAENSEQTSQVIANVNGYEVTVHELAHEMRSLRIPATADQEAVQERVLRSLISRKVFEQKAVSAGLDRNPTIMLDLKRARSNFLARSYLSTLASSYDAPTRNTAEQYVFDNPEIFANRTHYQFDSISIPKDTLSEEQKDEFEALDQLDSIEDRLEDMNVNFLRNPFSLFSETVPTAMKELLPSLMRDRTVFFIDQNDKTMIVKFERSSPKALTGADAIRVASSLLNRRAQSAHIAQEQAKILNESEISFFGKFADKDIMNSIGAEDVSDIVDSEDEQPVLEEDNTDTQSDDNM